MPLNTKHGACDISNTVTSIVHQSRSCVQSHITHGTTSHNNNNMSMYKSSTKKQPAHMLTYHDTASEQRHPLDQSNSIMHTVTLDLSTGSMNIVQLSCTWQSLWPCPKLSPQALTCALQLLLLLPLLCVFVAHHWCHWKHQQHHQWHVHFVCLLCCKQKHVKGTM